MLRKTARGNKRIAVIASLCVSILLTVTVYATGDYSIGITDDNQALFSNFITRQKVVDLLENNTPAIKKDTPLTNIENLAVGKTKRIIINDGETKNELYTSNTTVKELIDDKSIKLTSEFDFLNVSLDAVITNGLEIEVTHVTSENYKTTFEIPYQTITQEDATLPIGETRVISEGENGLAENNVEVIYHNGIEFKKNCTQSVLKEKVDRVVAIGTMEHMSYQPEIVEPLIVETSAGAIKLGEPMKFTATAYCACARCCGKSTGITASGMKAVYGVVAVDTRVIPLGTKLYIENADGSFTYGEAIAADTGGAIKGNKVDLFFPSHSEALAFGRKTVNVYIIG